VIDGGTNITTTVKAGTDPWAVAVNPVTNKIYVPNFNSANVTVITPVQTVPNPLTTMITPLPGDRTSQFSPTFSFTASSSYSPIAPPVQQIYYQMDTWTGEWLPASPAGASASGQTPPLQPGLHILYAFAVDGQEATSINTGTGSSPNPGQIAAYHFLVDSEPVLSLTKTVDDDTPQPGQTISYTITINNSGTAIATQAVISDTQPSHLTFGTVTIQGSGGAAGPPPLIASDLTINPGATVTVTLPATVSNSVAGGTVINNKASVTSVEVTKPVSDTVSVTVANTVGAKVKIFLPVILKSN
jgi:uncharacterized repeat protein (TIGR01451 family)